MVAGSKLINYKFFWTFGKIYKADNYIDRSNFQCKTMTKIRKTYIDLLKARKNCAKKAKNANIRANEKAKKKAAKEAKKEKKRER